jgi:hypothetical protein
MHGSSISGYIKLLLRFFDNHLYSSRVRRWHAQAGLKASCATGCSWVSHNSYWQQLISQHEYVIGSSHSFQAEQAYIECFHLYKTQISILYPPCVLCTCMAG